MLEFIHSNEQAKTETQKFILLASAKKNSGYDPKDFDKKQVIVGLFNLYINIIRGIGRNYELVSLQDFKIEEYISLETQDNIKTLEDIIKRVNSSRVSQAHIRQDLAETHDCVRPLDQVEDKAIIAEKKVENEELYFLYIYINIFEKNLEELEKQTNKLENILQASGLQSKRAYFREEQTFLTCLPIMENHIDIKNLSKRNILTSGLVSTYPFISSSVFDETKIFALPSLI